MHLSVDAHTDKSRRRSVDVGGLALALCEDSNHGSGHGWGGWEVSGEEPEYAELLSKMYNDTHYAVENDEPSAHMPVSDGIRERLIRLIDSWGFEPHKLPDDQLVYTSVLIFETLFRLEGLQQCVGVSLDQIRVLLCSLRKVYREQNSYHNFQHAVDVLQATHHMLLSAGKVPPVSVLLHETEVWSPDLTKVDPLVACLEPLDLFCLYVASIGHDVGHPGFTNAFMKNARAPLTELYDDKSPLERMHCTLLMHTLRRQGFGFLLDSPSSPHSFRKLLHETVLATDMRVHNDFMHNFQQLLDGHITDLWSKRVLVCQALIKCADISNPCRPMGVSQHWAMALAREWMSQAALEQYLNMPASLKPTDGPLSEARAQVFFIETFAWPLFKITSQGIPPTTIYTEQCDDNLIIWKDRVANLSASTSKDTAGNSSVCSQLTPSQLPEDYLSAFPMTLPTSLLNADNTERFSQSDWASITTRGSGSMSNSSRSASPSPVSLAPPPLLPRSAASTSSGSGSSGTPSSPILSPTEPLSDAPSRAVSIVSSSGTPFNVLNLGAASTCSDSGTAAIRAAYKVSVRKKSSFANRNSWSPAPRLQSGASGLSARRDAITNTNTSTIRRELQVPLAADDT